MVHGCDSTLVTGLMLPFLYGAYKAFNAYRSKDGMDSHIKPEIPVIQNYPQKWLSSSNLAERIYDLHVKLSKSILKTRAIVLPIDVSIWLIIFCIILLIIIIVQRWALKNLKREISQSIQLDCNPNFREAGSQTVISSHTSNLTALRSAGLKSWSLYSPFAKATIDVQSDIPIVLQGKSLGSSSSSSTLDFRKMSSDEANN